MIYRVVRSSDEIEDLIQLCMDQEMEGGSKYFGMTYEQGIKAGIDWMTTEDEPHPLEE